MQSVPRINSIHLIFFNYQVSNKSCHGNTIKGKVTRWNFLYLLEDVVFMRRPAISIDLIKPRLMDFSKSQQPIYYPQQISRASLAIYHSLR